MCARSGTSLPLWWVPGSPGPAVPTTSALAEPCLLFRWDRNGREGAGTVDTHTAEGRLDLGRSDPTWSTFMPAVNASFVACAVDQAARGRLANCVPFMGLPRGQLSHLTCEGLSSCQVCNPDQSRAPCEYTGTQVLGGGGETPSDSSECL